MKRLLLILCICLISNNAVLSATVEGGVTKTGTGNASRIIDNTTNMPVPHAKTKLYNIF